MKKALPYVLKQVLGITADNALNNDKMIDELQLLLDDFPGPANQTRCFLHILSITAKSIIKQFDVPKAKNGVVMDDAAQVLADIADGLEGEELDEYEDQDCEDDEVDDEPLDLWVDANSGLTDEWREAIELNIQPVRSTLTKVAKSISSHRLSLI
jgi:hypothetical protein